MCDPPKYGEEPVEDVDRYYQERGFVLDGLKKRAKLLEETFNDMEQISCTEIEGAMYGFPRVHFSQKFIDECEKAGTKPDF